MNRGEENKEDNGMRASLKRRRGSDSGREEESKEVYPVDIKTNNGANIFVGNQQL